MNWDQLTSPQVAALDKNLPVVFPVAATEQHGPHLPLATDRMIGEHFCNRLDQQINSEVLILPVMSVGCSSHHLDFAGSLSISHDTFLRQATDVLNTVIHHGFKNILVLNCHGGNIGVGTVFTEQFGAANPEVNLAFTSWWKLTGPELMSLNETGEGGVGHACEFETSLMQVIAPDLVDLDKIESKQNNSTFDWAESDMLRGSRASYYRSIKQMTANGVYGDATKSSPEKGQQITEIVVKQLVRLVTDLKKHSESK